MYRTTFPFEGYWDIVENEGKWVTIIYDSYKNAVDVNTFNTYGEAELYVSEWYY